MTTIVNFWFMTYMDNKYMKKLQQKNWDVSLFAAFYNSPDIIMYKFIRTLMERYEFTYDDLKNMKRTTKNYEQSKVTVAVFICNYLPSKISKQLWESSLENIPTIVSTMSENLDTLIKRKDKKIFDGEKKEIRSSKNSDKINSLERLGFSDHIVQIRNSLSPSNRARRNPRIRV